MSPTPFMKAACTGFPILHRLHLAALEWIIVIPLCRLMIIVWTLVIPKWNLVVTMQNLVLPLCLLVIPRRPPLPQAPHQELLSPCLFPESQGEGGGEGLAAQPMRIQRPAQPSQWPRMSAGPIIIRYLRERPSINQRPVTPPRWRVPQCTRVKASIPLIPHSLPFQRPIGIQSFHLGWSAVIFQGFISRPFQTSGRIWQLNLSEWTSQDQASPHLLYCNPASNPSLDGLLGLIWLVLHERLGELWERGLESSTHCCRAPNAQTPVSQ